MDLCCQKCQKRKQGYHFCCSCGWVAIMGKYVWCNVPSSWKQPHHLLCLFLDLYSSPHQFTSKSSPLQLPCSLPSHITWDQLKTRGIEEVQWQFSPNPPSGDRSNGQKQKLFSLSLDTLQWEPEHSLKTVRVADVTKGNLSLTKRQGKDGGDYECIVKFKGGVTLTRTVHVDVLRSKSKRAFTSLALTSILCALVPQCPGFTFWCPVSLFLIMVHKRLETVWQWTVQYLPPLCLCSFVPCSCFHLAAAEFIQVSLVSCVSNSVANAFV